MIHIRRTKILATLGPATDDPETLKKLLLAGVNAVRLNFSHGSHDEQLNRIKLVKKISQEIKRHIGIMADLQGPKIRVANFKNKSISLKNGASFILDADMDDNAGDEHSVGIDYKNLPKDVAPGDMLLLDDGRIAMQVLEVNHNKINCMVTTGGTLSNHKGINRQGGGLSAKALTNKDKKDLSFAVKNDVDYIAISFPRNADDILEAKELIKKECSDQPPGIIAKIERAEAIDEIDNIILASDGVMVARGDLAVEIGDAEVPLVQKKIIHCARSLDKPVIVATQMMESMITCNVPTRAEVSDVANAVLDNTDAIMLSAETAAGTYPIEAVEAMHRVCMRVEEQPQSQVSSHRVELLFSKIDETIAMAAMYAANHMECKAIIAMSSSGRTPLIMSRIRTSIPIYGFSHIHRTLGKMTLYRGIIPIRFDTRKFSNTLELNAAAITHLLAGGKFNDNDNIIITKGDTSGLSGGTNTLKILNIGDFK